MVFKKTCLKSVPTVTEVFSSWKGKKKKKTLAKTKRIGRITSYLLVFLGTMVCPTDTKKEAVFCMTLRLADTIWDLILISLFVKIRWTKPFLCLQLQNVI